MHSMNTDNEREIAEGLQERVFTQTFVVVGAILEKDGEVLLVQEHMPGRPDHGTWNQPAGWVDVGEDPLEAVKREVREETGYNFTPTHLVGIYSLVRYDLQKDDGSFPHAFKLIFAGEFDKTKRGDIYADVAQTKWFSLEEIEKMKGGSLRDDDIAREVREYFDDRRYPLDMIRHTTQK